jgi:phosphohistidine swiveling domain-containing protein
LAGKSGAGSYGAKADNLLRLAAAGFNVPPLYVVPAGTLAQLNDARTRHKLAGGFSAWAKQHHVAAAAVRSSSTVEDAAGQSFAGQFATVLGVRAADGLLAALETVRDSQPSAAYAPATGHNHNRHHSHGRTSATSAGAIHAIVQEFIEPDLAGVIFSVNPATGASDFVINLANGRGTHVVEGEAATQYFISRLDPTAPPRRVEPSGGGGPAGPPATLTPSQITALTTAVTRIETVFGLPQDVEWAIKGGQLYILQARPITRISHLRLWDSSNIAESFPGIVLPLTFSIARHGYMLAYKSQAQAAGLSWYELEARHRTLDHMIGIFNGRLYYNLLNWYKFIALFPGSGRNQQFLDAQIATQGAAAYQESARRPRGFVAKFAWRVLYRTVFFGRELRHFYARFARFEAELARLPQVGDTQTLMKQYALIEQTIIPHFGRTVDNDFFVMTYHGWLKRLLDSALPGRPNHTSILGSITGVMSADQAFALYDLAGRLRHDAAALSLLRAGNHAALDEHLRGTPLARDLAAYIATYGHRFAEDQKIEVPNPTLEPGGLYRLLAAYVQLDATAVKHRLEASLAATRAAERGLAVRLDPLRRVAYRWLLARLKHHLRLREKNRLLRGKVYGYLRALFPKVGQALVAEGVLGRPDDVYYLEIDELFAIQEGAFVAGDLRGRVGERRRAYERYRDIPMPERFITQGLSALEAAAVPPPVPPAAGPSTAGKSLRGLISSPGTVEGRALVLTEPRIPDEPYDILVAAHTDPGWTPLIALAKGVIVEHGGLLSHAAIVTRELGIPSIIGVPDATRLIKTGMRVRINTQTAAVDLLAE